MLRRMGYILGLLFVLACVAAYPLTWGMDTVVWRHRRGESVFVSLHCGRASIGYIKVTGQTPAFSAQQYALGLKKRGALSGVGVAQIYRGHKVYFPLWMPALAVSLFMAWRWRRRRTRVGGRSAAGFEVVKAG